LQIINTSGSEIKYLKIVNEFRQKYVNGFNKQMGAPEEKKKAL